ncbi:MAG TPA: hypothetical protein VGL35_14740 [Rhizomicrobium sp.]|jgi:hypothetical protein
MSLKFSGAVALTFAALALAGCRDASDLQSQSLANWKTYCASKGKQFLWHDTVKDEGIVMQSVKVNGRCVGPGERGYQTAAPDDQEP